MFEQLNQPFPEVGINIRILQAGQSNAYYHSENQQEDFLVLGGRCTLILDGTEHELHAWTSCTAQRGHDTPSSGPVTAHAGARRFRLSAHLRSRRRVRGPSGCLGARPTAVAAKVRMTSLGRSQFHARGTFFDCGLWSARFAGGVSLLTPVSHRR